MTVEKLRKDVAALEGKKAEYERRHRKAHDQKTDLERQRKELLARIAEGDDGARRDLRRLEAGSQETQEDELAFSTAGVEVALQLDAARSALAHAERQVAITALEDQVASLAPLDNEVETALAQVKEKSEALFSAAKEVAAQLFAMDEHRFDHAFGFKLTASIRDAIWHRFEEMGFPNTERRPSFMERATGRLRSAIAQLRYEALAGQVVPERGEQLYRAINRITGLRNLDLPAGALIALTPTEAASFVSGGFLQLVQEPAQHSGAAEEAA